ncbi:MAG: nucleoside-diphosphate sugar epimerase [Candidatus Cohnella colombiensis]|uniref:Nucleoside-diphosphate sugar epimerase n=1 Tax=Candidatus Cohnella colombiensis TaxID=3121368 RepID=A0AA95EUW2_9BACL|nr:MAG: nucleoside-diphosphate sugar epimerase [Cohnella sp.]
MSQELLTEIVTHLSHSHQQMARIIHAKREVSVRMAQLVDALPDAHPQLNGLPGLLDNSGQVTKSIIAYLNSLADLEEAVAESLTHVMKAMENAGDEE